MWPLIWALRPLRGILGALKGTCRVYSRYIRIPGLRAHIWAHGFKFTWGMGFTYWFLRGSGS